MKDDETTQLADEGYHNLSRGDFARVLEIADTLENLRYSACFELRGRALAALGREEEAVAALQAGTRRAPAATQNWHWLGTILSGMGRYGEALAAFDAEAAHGGDASSVALNKAIVHHRSGDCVRALAALPLRPENAPAAQAWHAYRAAILLGLSRTEEAARDADAAVALAAVDGVATEMIVFARQTDARILLRQGKRADAEAAALCLVHEDTADLRSCRLLREIRGQSLDGRRCLRLLVHGVPVDREGKGGVYANYLVNASDKAEALAFVREVEGRIIDPNSLAVEECADVTEDPARPDYPFAGVVARVGGYHLYSESD